MQASEQTGFKITPAVKREIERIIDERIGMIRVSIGDFSELKGIVKELAEAQKQSEIKLSRLEEKVEELAEAQKKTEERVNELAEAQKKTEERLTRLEGIVAELAEAQKQTEIRLARLEAKVEELAEAQRRTEEEIQKLAIGLNNLRGDVGGLARSFGYAFENEAYRMLPGALKEKYGIEITERLIRAEIGDTEINILGLGRRNGSEVVVVGEAKTRLERMEVFDEIEDKVKAVKAEYGDKEIVKVLVTHFATKRIQKVAKDNGIIVVQSFEW